MRSEKVRILKTVFGSCYERGPEFLFRCPYCHHYKRKFSVNVEKGYYKCWICDKRGRNVGHPIRRFGTLTNFREWQELVGKVDLGEFDNLFGNAEEEEQEMILKLPEEYVSLANKGLPRTAMPFLSYLAKRQLSKKDVFKWKIGFCFEGEYANRIIIPSFNKDGFVNYFVARSIVDYQKKYKNPPVSKDIIFNELYVDWDEDVVVVEGIFDAIRACNGIPILGSTLREGSKLFKALVKSGVKVFLALDEDAETKTNKIIHSLMSYGVEVSKIDTSGYDDIAEMSPEVFEERKKNAVFMTPDNHLRERLAAV
jgi:DNA primase